MSQPLPSLLLPPGVLRLGRLQVAPRYWVVAGQATASATNFITNLFIAKLCGLAVFGEYSAWQLVLLLVLAAQGAAITQPMQVVLGSLTAGRRVAYGQLVLGGQLVFSTLAALGTVAGAAWLPQAGAVLPAFLVVLVAGGAQDTLRKLLLAEGRVQAALAVDALSGGGQLLALLALALRAAPASLPAVMWVVGLTSVPAVLAGGWALGVRPRLSAQALRRYGRRHWRQARWLLPTALLQWGSANVLLVFAGWVGSPVMLGVLRLAQTAMGVFNLGLQAVENYALPRLSQSFHHAPATFARQRAALSGKTLLAAGPLLAALALGAGPLLAHFGPQGGAEYASLLRWCCLLYAVILLVYPLRLTVRLLGDSRHYFAGYVLSIAASLASVRWLTSHYQASGVVLGWLLAQLVLGAYWLVAVRRKN